MLGSRCMFTAVGERKGSTTAVAAFSPPSPAREGVGGVRRSASYGPAGGAASWRRKTSRVAP